MDEEGKESFSVHTWGSFLWTEQQDGEDEKWYQLTNPEELSIILEQVLEGVNPSQFKITEPIRAVFDDGIMIS